MKANCLDGHKRIADLLECEIVVPDQQEVDDGQRPHIYIDVSEIVFESVMMEQAASQATAVFNVDLLNLCIDSIESDRRHGEEFMAEQADVLAEWLEEHASELRNRYKSGAASEIGKEREAMP